VYADFVALGHAAGLGVPSRLGLLIHPEFGPWLSLRAAILCERTLVPTPELVRFEPCAGCPAPCAGACHGEALAGARFDTAACLATRLREPACKARCDARRACVYGREHAYREHAEAHHMRAAGALAGRG
jgi:epoxyqueuosine reductase QueG